VIAKSFVSSSPTFFFPRVIVLTCVFIFHTIFLFFGVFLRLLFFVYRFFMRTSYKTHQLICTICPRSLKILFEAIKNCSCVISTILFFNRNATKLKCLIDPLNSPIMEVNSNVFFSCIELTVSSLSATLTDCKELFTITNQIKWQPY